MKEIEFKQQTNTAKWYKFFWGVNGWEREMPEDTCTYYRNIILSIPLAIIAHIGVLWAWIFKSTMSFWEKLGATAAFWFIPIVFGVGILKSQKDYDRGFFYVWFWGVVILLCIIIVISIILFIVYLIDKAVKSCKNRRFKSSHELENKPNIISLWYKQLKDKTCSKIRWI